MKTGKGKKLQVIQVQNIMRLIYITVVVLLIGCVQSQKRQSDVETKKESKYKELLSKFKDRSFDTLKVYSPEELTGEYKGVELDSADAVLFPEDIAQQHFNDPPGLFAIYKFSIDSNKIGLIARTPSEYVPSSIKLFLFDRAKDTITSYIELAESWGDAGDYMTKNAWIYKENGKSLRTLIWLMEGHDNSVEDERDTTHEERNYYYLVDLSNGEIDTISKDDQGLEKKFSNLLSPKRR